MNQKISERDNVNQYQNGSEMVFRDPGEEIHAKIDQMINTKKGPVKQYNNNPPKREPVKSSLEIIPGYSTHLMSARGQKR